MARPSKRPPRSSRPTPPAPGRARAHRTGRGPPKPPKPLGPRPHHLGRPHRLDPARPEVLCREHRRDDQHHAQRDHAPPLDAAPHLQPQRQPLPHSRPGPLPPAPLRHSLTSPGSAARCRRHHRPPSLAHPRRPRPGQHRRPAPRARPPHRPRRSTGAHSPLRSQRPGATGRRPPPEQEPPAPRPPRRATPFPPSDLPLGNPGGPCPNSRGSLARSANSASARRRSVSADARRRPALPLGCRGRCRARPSEDGPAARAAGDRRRA